MIVKRQSRPLPGTRLAETRERSRWPSQSKAFWAGILTRDLADEQGVVRGRVRGALGKLYQNGAERG